MCSLKAKPSRWLSRRKNVLLLFFNEIFVGDAIDDEAIGSNPNRSWRVFAHPSRGRAGFELRLIRCGAPFVNVAVIQVTEREGGCQWAPCGLTARRHRSSFRLRMLEGYVTFGVLAG